MVSLLRLRPRTHTPASHHQHSCMPMQDQSMAVLAKPDTRCASLLYAEDDVRGEIASNHRNFELNSSVSVELRVSPASCEQNLITWQPSASTLISSTRTASALYSLNKSCGKVSSPLCQHRALWVLTCLYNCSTRSGLSRSERCVRIGSWKM